MNNDNKSNDRIGVGTKLLLRSIAIGERVRFLQKTLTLPFLNHHHKSQNPPKRSSGFIRRASDKKNPCAGGDAS